MSRRSPKSAMPRHAGSPPLCDSVVVIGFLAKSSNGYALTPDAAVFLDRNSPACTPITRAIRRRVECSISPHATVFSGRAFGVSPRVSGNR